MFTLCSYWRLQFSSVVILKHVSKIVLSRWYKASMYVELLCYKYKGDSRFRNCLLNEFCTFHNQNTRDNSPPSGGVCGADRSPPACFLNLGIWPSVWPPPPSLDWSPCPEPPENEQKREVLRWGGDNMFRNHVVIAQPLERCTFTSSHFNHLMALW